jgi:hypothetical protein
MLDEQLERPSQRACSFDQNEKAMPWLLASVIQVIQAGACKFEFTNKIIS